MKTLTTLFGAAILAASAATAMAEDALPTEEFTFNFDMSADALQSEAGAAKAYDALVREARKACTLDGVRGFDVVDEACVADLVNKVVVTIDSEMLDAAYESSDLAQLAPSEAIYLASR